MSQRVILYTNTPNPYVISRFSELSKLVDLKVIFQMEKLSNRRWKLEPSKFDFEYCILGGRKIELGRKDKNYFSLSTKLLSLLEKEKKIDCFISHGWESLGTYLAFSYCKRKKIPFLIYSESTAREKSILRLISLPLVKYVVKNSEAAIVAGKNSRDYLTSLGANEKKIFKAPNAVNNSNFKLKLSRKDKAKLKEKYGIPKEDKVLLYIGQLIDRKGVKYLLDSFNELTQQDKKLSLIIVGEGPQKKELLAKTCELGLDKAYFLGYLPDEELKKIYGLADLFVLPSYEEVWGLVINEAMCSGLPVITTRNVGSAIDLVKNGINGYIIKEKNSEELAQAILKVFKEKDKSNKMGGASKNIIKDFTPKKTAQGIYEAVKFVSR